MENRKRKSLDEFSDESERFEHRFDEFLAGEHDESERAGLFAEITEWMQECANEGRFIPLASAERRAFRSLLERWSSRLRDQGHYLEAIGSLADFDPSAGIVLTGDCPYPGLEPYTQSRRAHFFGREALVSSCVAHLELPGSRILLIVGASGSGKSSLALAGVLPQLAQRHDEAWLFAPRLTPGAHPLAALAEAVAQVIGRPDQAIEIKRGLGEKPGEALGQLAALCQGKALTLFIDQFEELLTMCRDAGEHGVFSRVLCALSEPTGSYNGFSCRILLTLRTDHLARFESINALTQLHMRLVGEDNLHHVSAIGFEDIKRAIKGPADDVGLRFIPATLIDQLASQSAGLSNGLPLLQFALRRLWDTRPKNESGEPLDLITAEMVKGLPDVQRALGTVADGIFRTFSSSRQRICERLLLELLVLDESFEEPLRRRRNEAELAKVLEARFPAPGEVASVIDAFVAAGLLRRFGVRPNGQLEVAHEALLRHWDHIYRLLTGAEAKERLHLVKQIGREASDWTGHDKSSDYLSLRGERLARATAYAADGWLAEAEATAYVDACKAQEEAERLRDKLASEGKARADAAERARELAERRRLRLVRDIGWVASAAVLVLALAIFLAWYRADKESSARKLAMATEAELVRNPQGSLLLSIEAAKTLKSDLLPEVLRSDLLPEVQSALRSAIRASRVSGFFKSLGRTQIRAAAYTPDGSTLALGDSLGGVTLWDVATGLQRKALFAHVDHVKAIAFSPDGRKMATGSADGKVVIWDTETATPLHVLNGHVDEVMSLAFSRPDGTLLATAGDDAALRIWNVATGTPVGRPLYGHIGGIKKLVFGRDERQLVTAGVDHRVVVWDARQGRILYSFNSRNLFDIDLSTDGSLLAVATGINVEIWDTATRGRRWTFAGHTNVVTGVRFGRDNSKVATSSYDGTVGVWRLPRGDRDSQRQPEELTRIRTEPATDLGKTLITALAFSPGGDTVATAFASGTATIWNVAAGGELQTLTGHETGVEAVAFGPAGRTLAAAGGNNGQVLAWDLSGRSMELKFEGIRPPAKAVAFSEGGAFAIGSGQDVLVALPDASDPVRLEGHTRVVNDLAFSPDGSRLVSGSHDGKAIVWDVPTRKKIRVLEGHGGNVVAVAFSADGKTIATGSRDNTIILWHAGTLERKHIVKGHLLGILDLAFTPDSKRLVSGSLDKTVRVWDVATGTQQALLAPHTDVVNAVAVHGDHLVTGADDGIRLWDLRSLVPVPAFPARSDGAQSLAFSPDGRYLAAGARDGVVRVYAMQGRELVELANKRVRRGWTREECKAFLKRDECPRTKFSILDEADQSFEKLDMKAGERLLREAKRGGTADDEAIDAEVNSRLGTAFLWAASNVMQNPKLWEEAAKGAKSHELALRLLDGAKQKLTDRSFDPEVRWRELIAYQFVKRARELARDGKLKESTVAFQQARDEGWKLPGEAKDAAAQLIAVHTLDIQTLEQDPESVLKLFPAYGPGHRVLAELYKKRADYASAEKHYREATAKEGSAEPLELLAWLSIAQYGKRKDTKYATDAAEYAKRALALDRGSDYAWYALGYAEHFLKNNKGAVEAFDQVSPSAAFFADALNTAAAIYFEQLDDDRAAYRRIARAAQLAPDNLSVLSNYAEFLLASGLDGQAKLAAARAREHGKAKAHIRAAMSFMMFGAELFSGDRRRALAEIDEIDRHVKVAAVEASEAKAQGREPEGWEYKGTRRAMMRRQGSIATELRSPLLRVLTFVETNGHQGGLDDMRKLLKSQSAHK